MIKIAFLLSLFLLSSSSPASAQESEPLQIRDFCGLNTFRDPLKLNPCEAGAVSNMLTDSGFLEKRTGTTRMATILDGFPIRYLSEFIASSGSRYLISHSSSNIYQTDLGSASSAILVVDNGYEIDSVSAFGRHYFVNGKDAPFYWEVSSTSSISGMPTCSYVEFGDERLYCANDTVSSSRVNVSSFGGAGFWTVPSRLTADSPNNFTFQKDDGEGITCFKVTPWGKFIGKRRSFHILKGYDNNTYYKRVIDPSIGCVADRSFQMLDGIAVWLGLDAIYAWDGAGPPENISKDIEPTVLSIRQLNSIVDRWIVNSQLEWEEGTISKNGPTNSWSTTIDPGSIVPSSFSVTETTALHFASGTVSPAGSISTATASLSIAQYASTDTSQADFEAGTITNLNSTSSPGSLTLTGRSEYITNGDFETGGCSGWTCNGWAEHAGSGAGGSTSLRKACGTTIFFSVYEGSTQICQKSTTLGSYQGLSCLHADLTGGGLAVGDTAIVYISTSSDANTTGISATQTITYRGGTIEMQGMVSGQCFADNVSAVGYAITGSLVSRVFDTGFTPPIWGVFTRTATLPSGTTLSFFTSVSTASTGPWDGDVAVTDGSAITSAAKRYITVRSSFTHTADDTPTLSEYNFVYVASGTYTTKVYDTAFSTPIWGPVTVSTGTTISGGATLAVDTRVSTASVGGFDSYVSQTSGQRISSASKRFIDLRLTLDTSIASRTVVVSDLTIPAVSTGIYTSKVNFIGTDITSWKAGDFDDQLTGAAAFTYEVRSGSFSFGAADANPSWSAHTNHQTVSVSTAAYYQFRVTSSLVSSTETASIARAQTSWQEGTDIPVASGVKDHRYFLAVTTNPASVVNDLILVLQKNNKWTTFSGPKIRAMATFDNDLVAGSANTDSYVWKMMQKDVYSDDGSAIEASWETPCLDMGASNSFKTVWDPFIEAGYQAGTTMTFGYAVDKSTSGFTNATVNLDKTPGMINTRIPFSDGYIKGKCFTFRLGNSVLDKYIKVHSLTIPYTVEKWRSDDN